ncbi:hypothetical protein [Amycolatopsis sp. NPDC098790]|uniref:hypothetical protein n=1 Tax=Amycolatopsis sp. NPDC098790 TaxID=3363939 RepID=UPI0037F45ABC
MDAPVPRVPPTVSAELSNPGADQAISIVLCGLLHVQTAVSLHGPAGGKILRCGKVDEVGTVYP